LGRNSPGEPSPLSPKSAPISGTTLLPKTRTWQGIRYAEAEGVREIDIGPKTEVNPKLKERINERVKEWQKGKGTRVHLTQIHPWVDWQHRRYFYSTSSNESIIHAICVLHQLSPQNGHQVKFSLEFPNAPLGTIESLILHSMKAIAA
jgi:ergosteryl-3beta-O-L-aspartate synthase